ncbi:hypothetical protein D3C72_2128670 [compost metagenome]
MTLSTVAAAGASVCVVSSWKLDSSSTHTSGSDAEAMQADSLSSADGLILPATATLLPARSTSRPVSAVVVVLPLVPVIARIFGA